MKTVLAQPKPLAKLLLNITHTNSSDDNYNEGSDDVFPKDGNDHLEDVVYHMQAKR